MKSTLETLGPTRVRLDVEVAPVELEPSLQQAYKTLSSQVRIKGFRPGRVPPRLVEQYVGRGQVLAEAVNEAVPQFYTDAVREHQVKVLGQPDIEVKEMSDEQGLAFTAEVDVRPAIDLPDFSSLTVTIEDPDDLDSSVDEQIDGLRERFAVLAAAERAAAAGDYVTIDMSATVDGETVPGAETSGMSYEIGSETLVSGLDEALEGLSAGDSAEFPSTLYGQYEGKEAIVSVTVKSVKEKQLPELDDDFAQTASEFDTLEELRADFRERAARMGRLRQAMQARDLVVDALMDAVEVPLPESLVKAEVEHRRTSLLADLEAHGVAMEDYLRQVGKTDEEFEAEVLETAEKSVRGLLVLDAIADAEEVQVGDAEISEIIVRRAANSGMTPDDYARRVIEAGNLHVLAAEARRGQALAIVLEQAVVLDGAGERIDLDALVYGPGGVAPDTDDEAATDEAATDEAATDEEQAVQEQATDEAPAVQG